MTDLAKSCDVAIIGSGPAGLSTAIELKKLGINDIIVIERSEQAGGNPRHCGHSPFGMNEFKRVYFGPAYAKKMVETAESLDVKIALNTTVTVMGENGLLTLSTAAGRSQLQAKNVVISTGIREMPRAPRFVSGQRPMGIMTTGALQSTIYLSHKKPFTRPIIVGSELVSFSAIASCRHAGIKPVAMLEENSRITAYLPLKLLPKILGIEILQESRLLDIEGKQHVTGVNIVDATGETRNLSCDGVIFTGNFTPEASLARMAHLEIDPKTQGPVIDQYGRCSDPCYFATGNVLRPVETGGWCWREGVQTARFVKYSIEDKLPDTNNQLNIDIENAVIKYVVPQKISVTTSEQKAPDGFKDFQLRFHTKVKGTITISSGEKELTSKKINTRPERRTLISMPNFNGQFNQKRLTFQTLKINEE